MTKREFERLEKQFEDEYRENLRLAKEVMDENPEAFEGLKESRKEAFIERVARLSIVYHQSKKSARRELANS